MKGIQINEDLYVSAYPDTYPLDIHPSDNHPQPSTP